MEVVSCMGSKDEEVPSSRKLEREVEDRVSTGHPREGVFWTP